MSSPSLSHPDRTLWGQAWPGVSLYPSLVRWLALAALADWLIARTLARMAIFMPKPPALAVVYQFLGLAGGLATSLTALLGLITLGWIAWREWRAGAAWLAPVLLSLIALSLVWLVVPASSWFLVATHWLGLLAIGLILARGWGQSPEILSHLRLPVLLLPAMAFLAGRLYQAVSALYSAMSWPGPSFMASGLFYLGEALIVLSAVGLWWAYGSGASTRMWLVASFPALIFCAMHLVNPAMTGVLAIWSTGMTLFLPWPLYAASLWLVGVAVLASLRRGDPAGPAILLLAAGGYAPQLSAQVFVFLIALWLLASPEAQPGAAPLAAQAQSTDNSLATANPR